MITLSILFYIYLLAFFFCLGKLKRRIHKNLRLLAKEHKVPIHIKQKKDMYMHNRLCAGLFKWKVDKNKKLVPNHKKIFILKDEQHNPWVLAHELGHFVSVFFHNDRTEEAADRMAKVLIYGTGLTWYEKFLIQPMFWEPAIYRFWDKLRARYNG